MSTQPSHAPTPAEVVEEALTLLDAGTPPLDVARHFHLSLGALEQRLRRSGAIHAANRVEVARRRPA